MTTITQKEIRELIDSVNNYTCYDDAPMYVQQATHELLTKLTSALQALHDERAWCTDMEQAPMDGSHVYAVTKWGFETVYYRDDYREGGYWQNDGDSEPEPKMWRQLPPSLEEIGE